MVTQYISRKLGWTSLTVLAAGLLTVAPSRVVVVPSNFQPATPVANSSAGRPAGTSSAADTFARRVNGETENHASTRHGGCNLPAPTVTSNSPICAGDTLVLSATGVPPTATYAWSGPNGFTSTAAAPAIPNVAAADTGTYTLTITADTCTASGTTTVLVISQATATFSYPVTQFCLGGANPTATVTGTAGGTFSALPATGLALDSTTGAIDLVNSTVGTYDVVYTVAGPCGAADTVSVTLTAPATAGFSYPGLTNGGICRDTSAQLLTALLATGATSGTFTARGTGALALDSLTGEIDVLASQPGTYVIYNDVPGGNGCPAVRDSAAVRIENRNSYSVVTADSTSFCEGGQAVLGVLAAPLSGGGAPPISSPGIDSTSTIQWFDGGVALSGATNDTLTVTTTGRYHATITTAVGCVSLTDTLAVTVSPVDSAAFSYGADSTFCLGGPNPIPAIIGTPGGTFEADSGAVVNSTTGELDLLSSVVGTYVIAYFTSGPCPDTTSVTVTLLPAPSAAFFYAPRTGCAGSPGTLQAQVAVGATPGIYSADSAGLALDSTTGAIDLATSAPGTYVITNTVAGVGTCPAATATDTVTIAPGASATFGYGATTFCLSSTTNPAAAITGTAGGTFSAVPAAGLALDSTTGAIDLATSTAGTYLVAYTVAGACGATDTVNVTLSTSPTSTFSYPGAPDNTLCPQGAPATLTVQLAPGAVAGTFTSSDTAGLVLDSLTGTVNVAASVPGFYAITNTVAASGGCPADTTILFLTVAEPQYFSIRPADSTTFCAGDSVRLSVQNVTGQRGGPPLPPDTYQWLLNGAPIANATDSTYTATQAGSYSVLVVTLATNGCEFTSDTITITVNPLQSAAFSYPASTFCRSGANPTATITGTAGGTFTATGGLPVDPATGAIDLTAATSGTYTVTYQNTGPCSGTATATITITDAILADFTYATGPGQTLCAGAAGTVLPTFATGASGGTFSATPGGLSLDSLTGTVTPATSTAGTYVVTNVTAASGSCAADTATTSLTIEAAPTATVIANGPTAFCQGDSVTLTATGGASYVWNTGDTTASITVGVSGTYLVTLTNAAGCAATSDTTAVTVTPRPLATFSYGIGQLCAGTGGTLAPTAGPGATLGTFSTFPATGLTIDSTSGVITAATSLPGTYTVVNSVIGSGSCSGLFVADTVVVTVSPAPVADFSYVVDSACAGVNSALIPTIAPNGAQGSFTATPAGLSLDPGTGVVNSGTSQPGVYQVIHTATGSGSCSGVTDTDTATVTIRPTVATPTVTLTTLPSGAVRLSSSATVGNQWYFNGVPILGATGPTYTIGAAAQNGTYCVAASAAGSCPSAQTCQTVTVTGTADDQAATLGVHLYPVPTLDGDVTLELPATRQPVPVAVYDLAGRRVWQTTLPAASSATGPVRYALDLRALPTGVYVLRVTMPQGTATRHVVRE